MPHLAEIAQVWNATLTIPLLQCKALESKSILLDLAPKPKVTAPIGVGGWAYLQPTR